MYFTKMTPEAMHDFADRANLLKNSEIPRYWANMCEPQISWDAGSGHYESKILLTLNQEESFKLLAFARESGWNAFITNEKDNIYLTIQW